MARAKEPTAKPDYTEHRKRLRERFMQGGPDALPDYELMELVLFRVNAQKDTKPLAKALIKEFGGFAEAISAPPERLKQIYDVGDKTVIELKLIQAAAVRLARKTVIGRQALSSWTAVLDYCHASMAYEQREQFRILFLDRKNVLIADEVQQQGTVDHTPVYPREVVKRALELAATGIILVHNHPSGDPTPSRPDIDMTRRIVEAAEKLGIVVHDHVIIGRGGHSSLRSLNLM